jgi:hypothetical protein
MPDTRRIEPARAYGLNLLRAIATVRRTRVLAPRAQEETYVPSRSGQPHGAVSSR